MKRKILSIFLALVLVCSFSLVTAVPAAAVEPETVVLGGDVATAVKAQGSSDEYHIGTGSWAAVSGDPTATGKMELYIDPTLPPFDALGIFTIDDIASISYWTNKPGTPQDFYLAIYTVPDEVDDGPLGIGGWYGYRLNAEPYFSNSLNAPAGQWNQWNTDVGTNQLTFFDEAKILSLGFYGQPTLQDLQASMINWSSYGSYTDQDIDYGAETVKYITFQTGTTWCGTFEGNIDAITISLTGGASVTIDLEEYYAGVRVDDDATTEWYALPGNFATIQDGINNVAEGGMVNVAAGEYAGTIIINKSVTLLGANAGTHPAVGTHLTEIVGERGPESILPNGFYAISPAADGITVDGFKFTGAGGRTIDTYEDANNFHLTNCIFVNALSNNNLIQLASPAKSHTDVLIDFNLFQDLSTSSPTTSVGSLYFEGTCDQLRIAYNKFNGLSCGVYWAAETLVDGIIEGNEFDGTIDGTPGVGGPGLNIGEGGNIIIRDNWFHDMSYTGFQVGIIGGSVIDNTFEDMYPFESGGSWYPADAFQLWGGEWGTPVSTDVTITGNTIKFNNQSNDADEHGIRLRPGADAPNIHINSNDFINGDVSTTALAVRNQGTGIVDAEKNWWDDATGPYHATNPDGQGGAVSDDVDFSPWFGNEAGTTIVHLVTGPNPPPVVINGIATVGISGGDASQGTIGGYSEPGDPTGLFVGTDTTGVVFLDIKVTGYTDGIAHITVPYPDTDQDGIVDGTTNPQVFEHTLGLYYWDEAALPANSMWRLAANNTVHPVVNTVSGDIPVSALTGTPIGLGGYEALVAIDTILNLSNKSDPTSLKPDTVELTIKTNTAFLGAATIDLIFDPSVVEVLGVEGVGVDEAFVATSDFENLEVNLSYIVIGNDMQTVRFLAYQTGADGVDATVGDGAVVAEVQLKAVGSTMDFSPLRLEIITLKDNNLDRIPRTVGAPSFALVGGVGDANRDTYVDSNDLVEITCAILGVPGFSIDTPTMNVDGKDEVDAADCTYLARHLAGVDPYPLPPLGWIPPWAWAPPAPPAP